MSDHPWQIPLYRWRDDPRAIVVPRGSILAGKPASLDAAWCARWPVHDLVALATVLGVATSGNREAITERIVKAWKLREFLADASVPKLNGLPSRYLADLLRSIGEYVPPSRYGRAAALIGWRDRCRMNGRVALARATHYLHIRNALRNGLAVPEDVIRDYPELQHSDEDSPLLAGL